MIRVADMLRKTSEHGYSGSGMSLRENLQDCRNRKIKADSRRQFMKTGARPAFKSRMERIMPVTKARNGSRQTWRAYAEDARSNVGVRTKGTKTSKDVAVFVRRLQTAKKKSKTSVLLFR
jgi:hypothetical protein